MQLGQAKFVSPVHNDGIGVRNVDPGFDNRCAQKHIGALVIEVGHHLFQLALAHLTMADGDRRLWNQLLQFGGGVFNRTDLVMQVVNLPTTHQFPLYRLLYHAFVALPDKCLDR